MGIDLSCGVLEERSWLWFRTRITGLLSKPPGFTPDGRQMPLTRLGMAINPPKPPRK